MQFGAIGSTVQGPEVTVKCGGNGGGDEGEGGSGKGEGGGGGGGGGDGGDGGGDGGDGGDGYEHTRQPDLVEYQSSEDHWIVPGPKMKLEGPPPPMKPVNVPDGWLGMRRK
jgi:hypothetical protein